MTMTDTRQVPAWLDIDELVPADLRERYRVATARLEELATAAEALQDEAKALIEIGVVAAHAAGDAFMPLVPDEMRVALGDVGWQLWEVVSGYDVLRSTAVRISDALHPERYEMAAIATMNGESEAPSAS